LVQTFDRVLRIFHLDLVFTDWAAVSIEKGIVRDKKTFVLAAMATDEQIHRAAGTLSIIGFKRILAVETFINFLDGFFVFVEKRTDQTAFRIPFHIVNRNIFPGIGTLRK